MIAGQLEMSVESTSTAAATKRPPPPAKWTPKLWKQTSKEEACSASICARRCATASRLASTSRHENICRRRRKQRSPGSDAFSWKSLVQMMSGRTREKHMTGRTCASRGTEIGAEGAHVRAPLLKAGRCPSRIPRCIARHGYTIS